MKRNTRLIMTFIPLLGLVGLSVFWLAPSEPEEKILETIQWPLDASMVSQATRIDIQKSGQSVQLQRKETLWRVARPINTDVNPIKIENFLIQLHQIAPQQMLVASQKQSEWGFERPTASIAASNTLGEPIFQLSFGALNSYDQTVFTSVQLPDGSHTYYSLPRLMAYRLGLTLDELREKRIWPASDLQGLHVKYQRRAPSFAFEFVKSPPSSKGKRESPYRLLAPLQGMGDEIRLGQMLRFLGKVEIDRIETEDHQDRLGQWGLASPKWQIQVQNGSMNLPLIIRFGQRSDRPNDLYVTRGDVPWVGRLSAEHISALDYTLQKITDKRLFSFDAKRVSRWEIYSKSMGRIVLEKNKGDFTMLAPQPALIKKDAVNRSLLAFARMEGVQLVATTPDTFANELAQAQKNWEIKMSFWDRNRKEMDALYIFRKNPATLYGISTQARRVLKVSPQALKNLPANIEAWIDG